MTTVVNDASAGKRLPADVHAYVVLRGLSIFGDSAWMLASTWVVVSSGGPAQMGWYLALISVVKIGLMVPASVVAQRVGLRRTMIVSDLMAALVTIGIAVTWSRLHSPVLVVYLTGLALAVIESFYNPAATAFIRTVATDQYLSRALSLRQSVANLATIGGGVVGGWLIGRQGFEAVMLMDAASFGLIAAGLLGRFRGVGKAPLKDARARVAAHRAVWSTLRRLSGERVARVTLIRAAVVNLAGMGLINVGLVALARRNGWSPVTLAIAEGALSVGVIATGLLLSRASEPARPFTLSCWGYLVFSVAVLVMTTAHSIAICVATAVIAGAGIVVLSAYGDSALYKSLPTEDMALSSAVIAAIAMAGVPVGQASAGLLISSTNTIAANLTFGLVLVATALISVVLARVRPIKHST